MLPLPALHATHAGIWLAETAGVREVPRAEAIARAAETPHILLNAPLVGQRLGYPDLSGLDLLELFAFVFPARFVVPTVAGLCRAVGIEVPGDDGEAAGQLRAIADRLLATMGEEGWSQREGAWTANATLHRLGWGWAPLVGARLAKPERGERMLFARLPQWEEQAERAPPRTVTVSGADAIERLASLTGGGAEARTGQQAMAAEAAGMFAPRVGGRERRTWCWRRPGRASARRSPISRRPRCGPSGQGGRYGCRPSPRRCSGSSMRKASGSSPTRDERKRRIVVRKGRENYLCLLNLEDAMQGAFTGRAAVLAHLVGRWAAYSRMATWSAATCPAGCRACSAAPAQRR